MYGLDKDERREERCSSSNRTASGDSDVQSAITFAEGDHAIAPDGSEWVITDSLVNVMGESLTILDAADGSGERCGVTSVSEWQQWDVLRQTVVGWRCAVCETDGSGGKPRECPDCGSICTRVRREWRGA